MSLRAALVSCLVLGAIVGIGAVSVAIRVAHHVPETARPFFEMHADRIDTYLTPMIADAAVVNEHSSLTPHPRERDAGPRLNSLFDWESEGRVVERGSLATLNDVDPFPANLDFSWMKGLDQLDTWDIQSRFIAAEEDYTILTLPIPSVRNIQAWAKARLSSSHGSPDAKRDVANLGRLCIQSESLIVTMLGISLTRLAGEISEEEFQRWKRLAWAQSAFARTIEVGDAHRALAIDPRLRPFRCAGLNDAASMSLLMRPFLEPTHPHEYASLLHIVEQAASNECRLTWLKASWKARRGEAPATPAVLCMAGGRSTACALPAFAIDLPYVREALGQLVLSIALFNGFAVYEKPEL